MKKRSTLRPVGLLLIALAAMAAATAYATGPLMVGGPGAVPGVPYRWTINPLTYWTDLGLLGLQTNTDADTIVTQSFQVWQDAPTASITFAKDASNGGKLGADVTADNIMAVLGSIEGCGALGGIAMGRSIIYDVDGSAVAAVLGLANQNTVLGFASAACLGSNEVDNYYQRGYAVLNGRFLDGIDTFQNPEVPATEFKAVMIHEFGHLLGLDHSQINLACLTGGPGCDLQGLPTMFPILVDAAAMSTLATDDIAGLSELYPETVNNPPTQVPQATSFGRITGHILFSDGQTPAQGFNVIARRTDNPLVIAVSMVSGFLFTADAGNPIYPWPGSDFGSRNTDLIGFYYLPGLPPGNYTVEVEAINNTGDYPFVGGSGVGPIGNLGFQFPMPGTCVTEFLNDAESATDQCTDSNTRTVSAGVEVNTNTNIILNGTPPRYDAWEDGL
jgi:hypothetical protein